MNLNYKNRKSLHLYIIGMVLFFLIIIINPNNSYKSEISRESNKIETIDDKINPDPKISYWNTPPIYILNDNWSAGGFPWIDGGGSYAGTPENPHVIENVTIDCQFQNTGIIIQDSTEHFIIRNCKISYALPFIGGGQFIYITSGIELIDSCNGKIFNNTFSDNYFGIFPNFGLNYTIYNNTFNYNIYGIGYASDNCTIRDNDFNRGTAGIYLAGSNATLKRNNMTDCSIYLKTRSPIGRSNSHDIDTSNNVNRKPIYYFKNEIGLILNDITDLGQLLLANCNNSIISNLNISNAAGIVLSHCENNYVLNNNITESYGRGIFLSYCSNITIADNIINNNKKKEGIEVSDSSNNSLLRNYIFNSTSGGIYLSGEEIESIYNNIKENTIIKNSYGICLNNASSNIITENFIEESTNTGLLLTQTSGNSEYNLIFKNYFINNGEHAKDDYFNNIWNNLKIGNYWDNHSTTDDDGNGIDDSYYTYIGGLGGAIDYLPIHKNPFYDGEPIHIDGDYGIPYKSWNWASTRAWCSGTGTLEDPYTIENLEINGTGEVGSCILIENSNLYFKIDNCTLFNSLAETGSSGIKLNSVTNGLLTRNYCLNNSYGIYLNNSDNIDIVDNTVFNNSINGIYLENSDLNTISDNIVKNSSINGIYLNESHQNEIFNNDISNNGYCGIYLDPSNYNSIHHNTISYCNYGIRIEYSISNNVFDNTFSGNTVDISIISEPDNSDSNGNGDDDDKGDNIIPGYDILILIGVISICLLIGKILISKKKLRVYSI